MDSPFVDYKATELPIDKIISYFVKPKYISRLYTNKAAFITGQRGTGKTTILKYLANKYNEFDGKNSKERLGVYFRFEINRMSSFYGDLIKDKLWEDLFAHSLSLILCSELTNILISQKEHYQFEKEKFICQQVIKHFFLEDDKINDFKALQEFLEKQESVVAFYKRNPQKAELPIICDYGLVFENFCKLISEERVFKNVCVHFLFDEYENLYEYQQKIINTFVKNSSQFHTYKICVRPKGIKYCTLSSEYIRATDDFQELDFNDDIIGNDSDTKVFIKDMCSKRLQEYYNNNNIKYDSCDLDIEKYLESVSDEKLFENISKKNNYMLLLENELELLFQLYKPKILKHSIQELSLFDLRLLLVLSNKRGFNLRKTLSSIKTKDSKYLNWVHNYKKAILFLCCHESQTPYLYGGVDDIISISGKVIRYVLEICDASFPFMEKNRKIFEKINIETQTNAFRRVSELRFQQIITIPDVGHSIKQLIFVTGRIFSMYHKDKSIAKFEPNHFSLHQLSNEFSQKDFESVKQVLNTAMKWGVLLSNKTTKEKNEYNNTDEDIDYVMHPIFTPYFKISARRKQKCVFSYEEIKCFLDENTKGIERILKKYHRNIKFLNEKYDDNQISLFEVNDESFQQND